MQRIAVPLTWLALLDDGHARFRRTGASPESKGMDCARFRYIVEEDTGLRESYRVPASLRGPKRSPVCGLEFDRLSESQP